MSPWLWAVTQEEETKAKITGTKNKEKWNVKTLVYSNKEWNTCLLMINSSALKISKKQKSPR